MGYETDPHDYLDEEVVEYESDFKERKSKMKRRNRSDIPTRDLISNLKYVLEGSHLIVLWLDNDSAGENICFQIMNMIEREKIDC